MKVVSVMNQKGGVGKSTTAVNTSAEFARRGKRTLLIDMDKQGNASKVVSGGLRNDDFPVSITDFFVKKSKVKLADAIYESGYDNLWYCPATADFQAVLDDCMGRFQREYILQGGLKSIADEFDVVVIDCPPNLGLGVVNTIVLSDLYLVPLAGDDFSIEGLTDLLQVLDEMEMETPLAIFKNIVNKSNTIVNGVIDDALSEAIELKLIAPEDILKTEVRQREVVKHANIDRKPLLQYYAKADVNEDYQSLVGEVLERLSV